jgi:hypothetical protein
LDFVFSLEERLEYSDSEMLAGSVAVDSSLCKVNIFITSYQTVESGKQREQRAGKWKSTEAEFLDVIGTKVLAFHSHL